MAGLLGMAPCPVSPVSATEAVDPEGRVWPWTKRSDAATAVYLVVNHARERLG